MSFAARVTGCAVFNALDFHRVRHVESFHNNDGVFSGGPTSVILSGFSMRRARLRSILDKFNNEQPPDPRCLAERILFNRLAAAQKTLGMYRCEMVGIWSYATEP